MDTNKLKKLESLNYKIYKCCGLCKHANLFKDDWSTCTIHSYDHLKHSESTRQLSIFKYGACDHFVAKIDFDPTWSQFIK